jgi:hypothetical protein
MGVLQTNMVVLLAAVVVVVVDVLDVVKIAPRQAWLDTESC